jgi:hypothetical protein
MTSEMIEERPLDRHLIVRNVAIYGPASALVVLLLFLAAGALFTGRLGAILPTIVLTIVVFAVVYELVAALRDLRAEPVTVEGTTGRIWKKSKFMFFGRQDYLLVDRKVFEIGRVAATELEAGQRVSIRHWPHTMRVITLERIREEQPRRRRRPASLPHPCR